MSKIWLVLFLIASTSVLIVCFVYGWTATIFPSVLMLCFFGAFLLVTFNASFQASVNPGLEKLDKPSFWFSPIYNAWLYVKDKEGWALYASLCSYLLGAWLGSIFGGIILFSWNVGFSVSIASWLSGMFLGLSIAMLIATSDYWSKTEGHDSSYDYGEEQESSSCSLL